MKRYVFKKLGIVLALLIVVTSLSACAGGGKNTEKNDAKTSTPETKKVDKGEQKENTNPSTWVSDEKVKITMLVKDSAEAPFSDEWPTIKIIKELTNVDLVIEAAPQSDYLDKVRLLLSSGNAPDIITASGGGDEIETFKQSGAVLPLNEYFHLMPYYMARLKELGYEEDYYLYHTSSDGNVYATDAIEEIPMVTAAIEVRQDLFEKHNIQTPKTYDDLYEALKILKSEYPESYPLTNLYGADMLYYMTSLSFGTLGGWADNHNGYMITEDNEVYYGLTSSDHREYLAYFNKLYKEGLLDPESFTQSQDQWVSKMSTGKSFVTFDWIGMLSEAVVAGKENNPDFNIEPILPLSGNGFPAKTAPSGRSLPGFVIPASAKNKKNLESIIRFADYMFYSPEANDLFLYGIEGETYEVVDGNKQYLPNVKHEILNPDGEVDVKRAYGLAHKSLVGIWPKDYQLYTGSDVVSTYNKGLDENNMYAYYKPNFKLDEMAAEKVNILLPALIDYVNQAQIEFIFGKLSIEDDWDNYVAQCKLKGVDQILELYKEAWSKQVQ